MKKIVWLTGCMIIVLAAQVCGMAGKVESIADKVQLNLTVQKRGHGAVLKITAQNISKNKIALVFPSANTNDFLIKDQGDKLVWQWTKDRLFKEKPHQVQIDPGKSVVYTANWDFSDLDGKDVVAGKYRVTGILSVRPTKIPTETKTIEIVDEDLKIAGGYIITGRISVTGDRVVVNSDDGGTYVLANEINIFKKLGGKYIRVYAPAIESIPSSKEKKMTVDNYKIFDSRPTD